MGESQDILVILYHQSPDHGPLREGDAGWIFDQNIFLEAMSVVFVVTETEWIGHPEKLTGVLIRLHICDHRILSNIFKSPTTYTSYSVPTVDTNVVRLDPSF